LFALLGLVPHLADGGGGHADDPVRVAGDQVSGMDGDVAEPDRLTESAVPVRVLAGPADAQPFGEDRPPEFDEPPRVADAPVDDEPGESPGDRGLGQDLTPVAVLEATAGVDDEYLTGACRVDGRVQPQVVTWWYPDREGRRFQAHVRGQRLDRRRQRANPARGLVRRGRAERYTGSAGHGHDDRPPACCRSW
jgi:hypothetical protein